MKHYFIEDTIYGYQMLGLFPYPKDAVNFFKLMMKRAGDGKTYYLLDENGITLAKGKGVPQGTTWILSPALIGMSYKSVGEEW